MQPKTRRNLIGAAIALIAIVSIFAAVFNTRSVQEVQDFKVSTPVLENAPVLGEVDVEKVLAAEHFRIVRRVGQIPPVVKKSFSNFTKLPFDLVNPEEEINQDYIAPGKSSRKLVFLALSSDSAVLVYKQGGFVETCNVVVFWYGDGGYGWGATVEHAVADIPSLKTVILNQRFGNWKRTEIPN